MENVKQIIYRHSDQALMIIPENNEIEVTPRFIFELTKEQQISFLELEIFCLTQKNPLVYVVYTSDVNRLDIQGDNDEVTCLLVSEMSSEDRLIVNQVKIICTELINN